MQIIGKKEFQQVYQSDYQLQLFTITKIACQITSNQLTFLSENHLDKGFFHVRTRACLFTFVRDSQDYNKHEP
jgi:hypothetical protein